MNNSEIQDKDFEINELCEKCSHLYLQHIMFGVDKINIDGACNMRVICVNAQNLFHRENLIKKFMQNSFNYNYAMITAAITLLGGITLFILNRFIEKNIYNLIEELQKIIDNIAIALIHYSRFYSSPVKFNYQEGTIFQKMRVDAMDKIKELASLLEVKSNRIPSFVYKIYENKKSIPSKKNINEACKNLTGLSYCFFAQGTGERNSELTKQIRILLNIPKCRENN